MNKRVGSLVGVLLFRLRCLGLSVLNIWERGYSIGEEKGIFIEFSFVWVEVCIG